MLRSNSDPNLLLFDPEIERILRRARQVRRRVDFEYILCSQAAELADSDFRTSSDTSTFTMGDVPQLTLKKLGGAYTVLDNQCTRYPDLNANFELKSGLINVLPRFHRLSPLGIKPIFDELFYLGSTSNLENGAYAYTPKALVHTHPRLDNIYK
ncbi:hypothetical protein PIB30_045609 [Stylosanthes scabra]|uniref:Uncharacterized protein n=1 Tax=Stylosanthes scabra TaxID=79078 RepID=A0ABU6SGZ5_9FABA|nr:hypothetical protein [Stylosanthes scabra]